GLGDRNLAELREGRITRAKTRVLDQRVEARLDARDRTGGVRQAMNRDPHLVQGVDTLIHAVVEKLQLADVHFCGFHLSASSRQLLPGLDLKRAASFIEFVGSWQ